MKTYDSKLGNLMEMIKNIMDKNQNSNYSPDNMDSPKAQDSTTVIPANKKVPPLEGEHSTKIGGMWTLKHKIHHHQDITQMWN